MYCGIDWAEKHHDVALVDAEGKLVAKRRIADSAAGFAELTAMLADAGDSEEAPIPVAIETSRGLLVAALRATGRPVFPINPMAVARYRERHSVSRKKSDHVDAMTLANILRTDISHAPAVAGGHRAGPRYRCAGPRPPGRDVAADPGRQRAAFPAARVLPRIPGRLRRWQRHQPGYRRRPCRVGDCADSGGRRQADQGPHRWPRCGGAAASAIWTSSPSGCTRTFVARSCVKTRWWKRRWAPRRCGCWPP